MQDVTGFGAGRAVDDGVSFDDPDREAGHVELAGLEQPGMLGQLAADDGAARGPAAGGDAGHHLADLVRVDLAEQLVVQEKEGPGAAAHQVVHAHGHQVDPDGVETAGCHGHRHLGADAIGARHQDRAAVAGRDLEQPAEAPDPAQHPRAIRG